MVYRVVLKGNKMGGKAICTFLITSHHLFNHILLMGISLCSELFSKKYPNAPLHSLEHNVTVNSSYPVLKEHQIDLEISKSKLNLRTCQFSALLDCTVHRIVYPSQTGVVFNIHSIIHCQIFSLMKNNRTQTLQLAQFQL